MIDPVGAVNCHSSFALFGYEFGKFGLMIPWKQQSTSESKPSEAGQLFDPHTSPS